MPPTLSGPRLLRRTAGAVGAVALIALGAAPAGATDARPGLVLGRIAPIDGVRPGSELKVPASFTNTGTVALDKVWMSYSVTRGLSHTEVPSNCLRYEIPSFDEAPSSSDVVCEFDQQVEPGVVYTPDRTLALKALDRALYDELRVTVATYDPAFTDAGPPPVRGTGPAVKLVERPDETPAAPGSARHEEWDAATVKVTAKNTADFQVTGARLKGKVGDTVPLVVQFTNAGPGWVLREIGSGATRVHIKVPAGTSVTKTDGFCKSVGSRTYECGTSEAWVDENSGETYEFRLKINKVVSGAKGSVALAGEPRPFDTEKANDTADILLDVSGDGSTGGSGSTGSTGGSATGSTGGSGSGTGSGSGSGSSSGSASGSSSSATGGTTTGTSGSYSTGGHLASTGTGSVLPLTAAAVGAVVLGTGTVLVVRRRAGRRD
ncbi:hypothetical protein ACIF83_23920 [Streptomyces sp. NPDC085866]|uniref:hypothetical protein n=1 Tax=Streptomyces sp. NPDC085866 TaxID=3365736 RepID=UPI0037D5A1A0